MCIPVLNLEECNKSIELNMVSCGAQSSVPVAYTMGKTFKNRIDYIETASTISSKVVHQGLIWTNIFIQRKEL